MIIPMDMEKFDKIQHSFFYLKKKTKNFQKKIRGEHPPLEEEHLQR